MAAVRVVITLRPGVLDAPGQAIRQGLRALGYAVDEVRVGKYLEIVLPDGGREAVDEMCERFLANPLIETWQVYPVDVPVHPRAQEPPGEAAPKRAAEAAR